MVSAMMAPLIALLLLLPLFVLGIVLFIVGLVKKKPAMWGSGIAIGVLSLLVLTVGAGMLMFFSVRKARTQTMARVQALRARTQALSNTKALDFHTITGLDLPDGVSITRTTASFSASAGADAQTLVSICRMSVPADFDEFLAANFTKAQWAAVAPTFQSGRMNDQSFLPSDDQLKKASLCMKTHQPDPNSPQTFVTAIAHDANTQGAWAVSVEKPAPAD